MSLFTPVELTMETLDNFTVACFLVTNVMHSGVAKGTSNVTCLALSLEADVLVLARMLSTLGQVPMAYSTSSCDLLVRKPMSEIVVSCDNACVNSKYACDTVFIPSPLRNNALAHSEYLKHLKNNIDMLREIIEESSKEKSHDTAIQIYAFSLIDHKNL